MVNESPMFELLRFNNILLVHLNQSEESVPIKLEVFITHIQLSRNVKKRTFEHVRPGKIQTSLRILAC